MLDNLSIVQVDTIMDGLPSEAPAERPPFANCGTKRIPTFQYFTRYTCSHGRTVGARAPFWRQKCQNCPIQAETLHAEAMLQEALNMSALSMETPDMDTAVEPQNQSQQSGDMPQGHSQQGSLQCEASLAHYAGDEELQSPPQVTPPVKQRTPQFLLPVSTPEDLKKTRARA